MSVIRRLAVRCSHCSRKVRPVVAVDIDGTLGDYHGHFLAFAEAYLGVEAVDLGSYDGTISFRHWFLNTFALENDRAWYDIKLAYRQGGMKRSMPIMKDATDFMQWLHRAGVEVWITTTRPFLRLDGIDPDTRHWLERNSIPYTGLLYDEDKYIRLGDNVEKDRVVAILDDLGEQYDAAEGVFGGSVPILRRNAYNVGVKREIIASNLEVARQLIAARLTEWKVQHGS